MSEISTLRRKCRYLRLAQRSEWECRCSRFIGRARSARPAQADSNSRQAPPFWRGAYQVLLAALIQSRTIRVLKAAPHAGHLFVPKGRRSVRRQARFGMARGGPYQSGQRSNPVGRHSAMIKPLSSAGSSAGRAMPMQSRRSSCRGDQFSVRPRLAHGRIRQQCFAPYNATLLRRPSTNRQADGCFEASPAIS